MRVPYEKQVILHELGMPIDRDYSYLTYQDAFEWFEDRGVHLNTRYEYYIDGHTFNWQISWCDKEGPLFHDATYLFGDNGEYNDRSIRYPAILDKMIEVYKKQLQVSVEDLINLGVVQIVKPEDTSKQF